MNNLENTEGSFESVTDDEFSDQNYVVTKDDLLDENQDNLDDIENSPEKKRIKVNLHNVHSILLNLFEL